MNSSVKIFSVTAVALITLASSAGSAFAAETAWQKQHPRREQVNHRLANQDRRIHKEVKEGEISKTQASALHSEDRSIRGEERPWRVLMAATSRKPINTRSINKKTP